MEIVVRAVIVFAFLWGVTRAVGKHELGQLTSFELLLLITMGDLIQQGVTQEDYSLTGAVLAVSTFTVLIVTLSYISWRWRRPRPWLEGVPVVIVRNGELQGQVLRYERMPDSEVFEAAREQGIRDLREVELAVLEPDGSISFFTGEGSSGAPNKSTAG